MSAKDHAIDLYMRGIRDGQPHEALDRNIGDRYTQHSTGVRDGKEGFLEFFLPFLERNPSRDMQVVRALQDGPYVFVHVFQDINNGEAKWVTTDFFESDADGKIVEHWDVIGAYNAANPSGHSNIDGATEITDLDKTDANKALVKAFIDTCLIGGAMERAAEFIDAESYTQHNPLIGDGLAAAQEALSASDLTYQECFMMVGEGNFVATLNRAKQGDQDLCLCDLFRVENGKIVEHWDNFEPVPPRDEWVNSGKF